MSRCKIEGCRRDPVNVMCYAEGGVVAQDVCEKHARDVFEKYIPTGMKSWLVYWDGNYEGQKIAEILTPEFRCKSCCRNCEGVEWDFYSDGYSYDCPDCGNENHFEGPAAFEAFYLMPDFKKGAV